MRILFLSICILFISCGIPQFQIIQKPEIDYQNSTSIMIAVTFDFTDNDVSKGFLLYVRYSLENSTPGSFTSEEYKDSNKGNSREYLTSKGYITADYVDIDDSSYEPELSNNTSSLYVKHYEDISGQDQSVKIKINSDTSEYYITMTNIIDNSEITHKIGDRTDNNYLKAVKSFVGEDKENFDVINIEFAIIAKSVNMTTAIPETIYSEPVYLGSFELKI